MEVKRKHQCAMAQDTDVGAMEKERARRRLAQGREQQTSRQAKEVSRKTRIGKNKIPPRRLQRSLIDSDSWEKGGRLGEEMGQRVSKRAGARMR